MLRPALLFSVLAACGGRSGSTPDAPPPSPDADPIGPCASTFGEDLAPGFSRFDGTILAIVPPDYQMCAQPNHTHLVIQVEIAAKAYRMVVDVLSNQGSPDVLLDEVDAPLPSPAWSPGVHTGAALDYATTLGVHSGPFVAMPQAALVSKITSELTLGAPITIYATVGDQPDSAHLVHREGGNADGAIVVSPDTAPHWLLLRFDEQTF